MRRISQLSALSVCPRCCFMSWRLAYSTSLTRAHHRESSLNHCPLISRRQRHRRPGARERELKSPFFAIPFKLRFGLFLLAIGAPWNHGAAKRIERMISLDLMKRRSCAKSCEARDKKVHSQPLRSYNSVVLHGLTSFSSSEAECRTGSLQTDEN